MEASHDGSYNSLVSHFKMAATVPHTNFVWGPILKHVCIGHSSVVPNVMIVLQNARFFTKHPHARVDFTVIIVYYSTPQPK